MYYKSHPTFWGGKADAMVELLQTDIPVMGKVTDKRRPKLEDWRKVQNAYYRRYNDGDGFAGKLRHIGKRYGVEINALSGDKDLERLANRVFRAALEEYEAVHGSYLNAEMTEYLIKKAAA